MQAGLCPAALLSLFPIPGHDLMISCGVAPCYHVRTIVVSSRPHPHIMQTTPSSHTTQHTEPLLAFKVNSSMVANIEGHNLLSHHLLFQNSRRGEKLCPPAAPAPPGGDCKLSPIEAGRTGDPRHKDRDGVRVKSGDHTKTRPVLSAAAASFTMRPERERSSFTARPLLVNLQISRKKTDQMS